MALIHSSPTVFVAITGAQGVGKTTFATRLGEFIATRITCNVDVLGGLRERMEALGVNLGSASTAITIPAVYASQLERELDARPGLAILDRCVVDAIAYTRALKVTDNLQLRLYEAITSIAAKNILLVIHLQLTPFFEEKGGSHETRELRHEVAELIPDIITELRIPALHLDAALDDSLEEATRTILRLRPDLTQL